MADDLASVGVSVDTRQAEAALRALEQSAKRAGVSVDEFKARTEAFNAKSNQLAASTGKLTDETVKNTGATAQIATQMDKYAKVQQVANDAVAAMPRSMGGSIAFLGLFGIGFNTVLEAAVALFKYLREEAKTTEQVLSEHSRLLGVIKGNYDKVTQSTRDWFDQSKDVTKLQLLQDELDLRKKLQVEVGKTVSNLSRYSNVGDFFTTFFGDKKGERVVQEQFRPFEDAIIKLKDGFDQGRPSVYEFNTEVAKIGLSNPKLQEMATKLISGTGDASKLSVSLRQVSEMQKVVDGFKPSNSAARLLGLPEHSAEIDKVSVAFDRQIDSISRRNAALAAQTPTTAADAGAHERLRREAQARQQSDNAADLKEAA